MIAIDCVTCRLSYNSNWGQLNVQSGQHKFLTPETSVVSCDQADWKLKLGKHERNLLTGVMKRNWRQILGRVLSSDCALKAIPKYLIYIPKRENTTIQYIHPVPKSLKRDQRVQSENQNLCLHWIQGNQIRSKTGIHWWKLSHHRRFPNGSKKRNRMAQW